VRPGDFVDFWGRVVRWGDPSLTIELKVLSWRPASTEQWGVLDVNGVFVAIDRHGRKETLVPPRRASAASDDPRQYARGR
jgi:acyl-CoA hydrolase